MTTLRGRVWRLGRFVRYRLQLVRRRRGIVLEWVADHPVVVLPGVFNPKLFYSTEFLVRQLQAGLVRDGARVLELGTGSGIAAIVAAQRARTVVAIDSSHDAARCARINAMLNDVDDRLDVREGDLFEPVATERFDQILFNPPYLAGTPRNRAEQAFRGGDVHARFAAGVTARLHPGGEALVVLSTIGQEGAFLEAAERNGLASEIVAEQDLVSEVLRLYRFVPHGGTAAHGDHETAGGRRTP